MPITERRKYMRITTSIDAQFWAKGPSMTAGQAQVRDFSREGLGVVLPKSVKRDEHVDLTLRVPGDNVPIFATAEVAWAEPTKDRTGIGAGLRFVSIKPLDLARLLDFVYSRWLGRVKSDLTQ